MFGDIEEKRNHFKEAADHYLRATQLAPSEPNFYVLGLDLLRHWSFDPASKTFETGLKQYPDSQRMLSGLGISYYGAARYTDAIAVFSRLLEAEPNNPMFAEIFGRSCTVLTNSDDRVCLGLTELAQQHKGNANLCLYAAVAILHKPADPPALQTAYQLLDDAIKADPHMAMAHYELGLLLQQEEKWPESIPQLQTALALDPKLARAHYRLGLAYRRTGRKDDAQHEMAVDREEDQEQRNDLNARMQQITTLLVKMP